MIDFIKKRKIILLIIIVVVAFIFIAIKIKSNGTIETVSPITGDLVRMVKISGKVIPEKSVDLGFEISGTVVNIAKEVGQSVSRGDLLVRIDTGGISANILKAQAELALAQAELKKLDGAGIYEAQIENAKRAIIQTIIDTYTAANDAVHNKTDKFFLNPRSDQPEIIPTLNNEQDLRASINKDRVIMEETLDTWRALTTRLEVSTYTEEDLSTAKRYFAEVFSYISDVSRATNVFKSDNFLTQTVINGYRNDTTLARDNMNSSSQNLISAEDKLRGLLLEVPVQVARVNAARASLQNFRSQFSKSSLISPINGIVSKQETKVGQVVSPSTNIVSVISKKLEIEAFMPEVLISGVRIDNPAITTLDAYGEKESFAARLTHIDPAETIRDGVSTYKVKLVFNDVDDRIKSGMTANLNIETFRKNEVVLIPERTVVRENDKTFVYILSEDNKKKISIVIGGQDSSGNVELVSELPKDSKLIINPTQN